MSPVVMVVMFLACLYAGTLICTAYDVLPESFLKMPKMTLQKLKDLARSSGFTARCLDGEYRVTFASGVGGYDAATRERFAYYTTDLDDAYATLEDMIVECAQYGLPV